MFLVNVCTQVGGVGRDIIGVLVAGEWPALMEGGPQGSRVWFSARKLGDEEQHNDCTIKRPGTSALCGLVFAAWDPRQVTWTLKSVSSFIKWGYYYNLGSPYFKGFLLRLKEILDVKVLCKYTKIGSSNSSSGRGRNGNQVGVEASLPSSQRCSLRKDWASCLLTWHEGRRCHRPSLSTSWKGTPTLWPLVSFPRVSLCVFVVIISLGALPVSWQRTAVIGSSHTELVNSR